MPMTITTPPPVVTAPSSVIVNQGGTYAFGPGAISVTDQVNTTESMTLTAQHGTLTLTNTTGLTMVTGNGSGTVVLTGSLAILNTALGTLSYTPSVNYAGADTLSLSDEDTTDLLTGTASVSITNSSGAPQITDPGSVNVSEDGYLNFPGTISVADPEGSSEEMKLAVLEGTLSMTNTTGLAVTGNGTSQVTLTGSLPTLNTALATLRFTPPIGYSGPDTLSVSDEDPDDELSAANNVVVTVNPIPPLVLGPAQVTVAASGTLAFAGQNAVSVVALPGTAEMLTLSVQDGTLTLANTTGLSVTGNGTGTLQLSGSSATLNGDLTSLRYSPKAGFVGFDSLALSDYDFTSGLTGIGSVAIGVASQFPTIVAPTSVNVATNGQFAFTGLNTVSLADSSAATESMKLTVQHGTLTMTTTSGLTVTGNGASSVTLVGSPANLNTALATLSYTPTSGYLGTDSLSLSDADTTDNQQAQPVVVSIGVGIAIPTVTAPTLVSVPRNSAFDFTGQSAISVSDLSGVSEQLTLSALAGTLAVTTITGLTVSGNGTTSLTLTGSLSSLNAALSTLSYTPISGFVGIDKLDFEDEDTSDQASISGSTTIDVALPTPIVNAPPLVGVAENSSLAFTALNQISVADPNGTSEQFNLAVNDGVLKVATTTGLTVNGNGTGSVMLTGSLSNLNTALATLTYTPNSNFSGPDTLIATDEDTLDSLSTTAIIPISVFEVPPTITAPTTVNVPGNVPFSFTTANKISVADASGTSEQLTLAVNEGVLNLPSATGLTVNGNGTASVTVTGSLSNLNTALTTLVYTPKHGFAGSDTLTVTDEDTVDTFSAGTTITLTVTLIPPTITAPTSLGVAENGTFTFSTPNPISVVDSSGTSEQFTLAANHGVLFLPNTTGLTVSGNGSASVTVTGSISNLNTALGALSYSPKSGFTGPDVLTLSDESTINGLTASTTVSITVSNLAPVVASSFLRDPVKRHRNFHRRERDQGYRSGRHGRHVDACGAARRPRTLVLDRSDRHRQRRRDRHGHRVAHQYHLRPDHVALYKDVQLLRQRYVVPVGRGHGQRSDGNRQRSPGGGPAQNPTITAPTSIAVAQNGSANFTGTISVGDPVGTSEVMDLSVLVGTLTLSNTTGLSVTNNGTSSVTLTGSLNTLNADLATLKFTSTTGYNGPDTLSLTDEDLADGLSASTNVVITVVRGAPKITAPATVSVAENGLLAFTSPNTISLTDQGGKPEAFTLSVQHGTLKLATTTGLSVTGNGAATIQLSGSPANLNTALASLAYSPTTGYTGVDTLSLTDEDLNSGLTAEFRRGDRRRHNGPGDHRADVAERPAQRQLRVYQSQWNQRRGCEWNGREHDSFALRTARSHLDDQRPGVSTAQRRRHRVAVTLTGPLPI